MPKFRSDNTQGESVDTKESLSLNQYVDKQLQVVIQSNNYQEASIKQRKELIEKMLVQLKDEGAISHFYYSPDDHLFSFEYDDKTLGGVKIKDFNSMMN